jgi:uncharacterized protein with HEPN domain
MRDPRISLEEMIETIDALRQATKDMQFCDFSESWVVRLAAQRAVEIISEASRRLPEDVKERRPDVPWAKVRAIGNVLRHEYDRVSDRILWDLIHFDLPFLRQALAGLLADMREI